MNKPVWNSFLSINDITAIVATHERKEPLNKMITSFREYYPQLKIIAVDSSKTSDKREDIQHILTDSDIWISNQRNIALQEVKTSLFLLLDDDYVCTSKTDIKKMMHHVVNWMFHISWWAINNIWSEQYDFHGYYDIFWDTLYHRIDKKNPLSHQYDTIFNFFVWETAQIKAMGWWDGSLKYAREHDDFFLTAKEKKILISYDATVSVDHYSYYKHHGWTKCDACLRYFLWKWNIKNKVEIRLIQKGPLGPYISYHNCISNDQYIKKDIQEKIVSMYWNYPIIMSWNV